MWSSTCRSTWTHLSSSVASPRRAVTVTAAVRSTPKLIGSSTGDLWRMFGRPTEPIRTIRAAIRPIEFVMISSNPLISYLNELIDCHIFSKLNYFSKSNYLCLCPGKRPLAIRADFRRQFWHFHARATQSAAAASRRHQAASHSVRNPSAHRLHARRIIRMLLERSVVPSFIIQICSGWDTFRTLREWRLPTNQIPSQMICHNFERQYRPIRKLNGRISDWTARELCAISTRLGNAAN